MNYSVGAARPCMQNESLKPHLDLNSAQNNGFDPETNGLEAILGYFGGLGTHLTWPCPPKPAEASESCP